MYLAISLDRFIAVIGTGVVLLVAGSVSAQTVVVDNADPGFSVLSGSWSTGTSSPDKYGSDYRYTSSGGSLSEVEWTPDLPEAGQYQVSVWYPEGSNRADNAPYTVHHASGSTLFRVNQQINGGQWNVLGVFDFDVGDASVTLSDDANPSVVIADAVRFVGVDPQPAFRAFWADAFSPGFKSASEINAMVGRAQQGNYNAIVAEVLAYQDDRGGGHGAYWHSDIVPWADEVSTGFDPLAYLCQQAHAQGIEVHAWLVTYRVCTVWPPRNNPHVQDEWIMVLPEDMGGGPATIDGKYTLDPGSPDVQDYLLSIVREIVTNYEVDGINWDYIRYTDRDAGYPSDTSYDRSSLARFQQITGYGGTPSPDLSSWQDFRRRTISELVRRTRAEIASIDNPRQPLRHTADLFATGNAPSSFSSSDAYNLYQDWRTWIENGWLDAGMPMNYKREHIPEHAQWYRNWVSAAVDRWRYDRHIFCGQGNYLNDKAASVAQLEYVYAVGADGSCNYSYEATADEDHDGIPEADWSWYTYVSDHLFTAPAPLPVMPWRHPGTAVEGTLWGRITDYYTDLPLDDATVRVGGLEPVHTDGNGYYVVTMVPADADGVLYDVEVTLDGYPDGFAAGVQVVAGDVRRRDIALDTPPVPCDMNGDNVLDSSDLGGWTFCMVGPAITFPDGHFCRAGDADDDADVDLADFAMCQPYFAGP